MVVGSSGLEPPTSRLSGARSNLLSYEPSSRQTPYPPLPPAEKAPSLRCLSSFQPDPLRWALSGGKSGAFSIFLYWMVEINGIEPLTSCLQGRRSPSWAIPPSSKQASYRSLPAKAESSLIPLFLLFKEKPLRWAFLWVSKKWIFNFIFLCTL